MKRAKSPVLTRPATGYLSGVQSSREASIRLVRLEFDLARLEAGIEQSEARAKSYRKERQDALRQKQQLMQFLSREGLGEQPVYRRGT